MKNKILTELKLIKQLKEVVNSKEEYDLLREREREISPFFNNQKIERGLA